MKKSIKSVTWKSPSNIALVKYWGKRGNQFPMNPSVSFSLTKSTTITKLTWEKSSKGGVSFEFFLKGETKKSFNQKVKRHLEKVIQLPNFECLGDYHFTIESENTFPHSAGIASSASGMSALSLCLASFLEIEKGIELSLEEISAIARLGSGSACRSLFGSFCEWGIASVEHASALTKINKTFKDIQDAIIVVSSSEKKISSSLGHSLMGTNPFRNARIDQAHYNTGRVLDAITKGDWTEFVNVVENEALTLHAMMMTSDPGFILLTPETLMIIEKIREFRGSSKVDLCFTIDAGPNVHLLYPKKVAKLVQDFVHEELIAKLPIQEVIFDQIGTGPERLNDNR